MTQAELETLIAAELTYGGELGELVDRISDVVTTAALSEGGALSDTYERLALDRKVVAYALVWRKVRSVVEPEVQRWLAGS